MDRREAAGLLSSGGLHHFPLRQIPQPHQRELRDDERGEPEERGVGEAVGMEADAEHVGAEP